MFFLSCFGGGIRPRFVLVWNGWFVVIRNALMTELGWSQGPCRNEKRMDSCQCQDDSTDEINGIWLLSPISTNNSYPFRPQLTGVRRHTTYDLRSVIVPSAAHLGSLCILDHGKEICFGHLHGWGFTASLLHPFSTWYFWHSLMPWFFGRVRLWNCKALFHSHVCARSSGHG